MNCYRCGVEVAPTAKFCPSCGVRITDPQESTSVVAPVESIDDLLPRIRMTLAGEYEVEEELGRGGMAVVYKATEVGLHRPVALKILPPDAAFSPRAVERFRREAQMVAELDHPNIIPVYRVGQVGGVLHIAMRLIEGRSLDAIVASQGALPISVVIEVLRGAARGLAYAHERGIVHRDVKSANILIDRDGRVILTDFGVALRYSDMTLTATGTVIGTPPFMSPEQCDGHRAVAQSDQYSLGVVTFQMLTGTVPFHADTVVGLMQQHTKTPVPDVRRARDDVPTQLLEVLQRALAKKATDRYTATQDMVTAVEAIPFSEDQRNESERILQELARGDAVERVNTREMPALTELPTAPMTLSQETPGRVWLRRIGFVSTAVAFVLLLIWGIGRGRPNVRAADQPPPPEAAVAKVRLLTSPSDAVILVDGRRAGVGSLFDYPIDPGPHHILIQAVGYRDFDTVVVATAGQTLSLHRIQMGESAPPPAKHP